MCITIFHNRLASCYTDKVLGRSQDGKIIKELQRFNTSFSRFVDYVLTDDFSKSKSEHWRPQFLNCHYCEINYDMIGRVETFYEDLKFIALITNLTIANESNLQFHKTKLHKELTTEDKTIQLFSKLSKTQLEKLYNLYKMDFEVFGYHVYPFVPDPSYNNI